MDSRMQKFIKRTITIVVLLIVAAIFNPLVVTRADEYVLIKQFGKVVRVVRVQGNV